jgi:hypothetical protein
MPIIIHQFIWLMVSDFYESVFLKVVYTPDVCLHILPFAVMA